MRSERTSIGALKQISHAFSFISFKTSGFVFEPREGDADVVVLVVDIAFLSSGDVGFLIG